MTIGLPKIFLNDLSSAWGLFKALIDPVQKICATLFNALAGAQFSPRVLRDKFLHEIRYLPKAQVTNF